MIGDHYQTSKTANWRMYDIRMIIRGIMYDISQPIDSIMLLLYLYNPHWYLLVLDITNKLQYYI